MTDGHVDRPLALAHAALARYALGGYRLVRLAESFNTVYRVDTTSGSFALRVGPADRVHAPEGVHAEAGWTRQLAERGLIVPQLVPAADGASSVRVAVADVPGERECSVWTWVPGRPRATVDVGRLAALSAALHDASPPLPSAPAGALTARCVRWFDIPDRLSQITGPHRGVLVAARDRAQRAVDRLWQTSTTPPRLVHGDLTPGNVVEQDGTLFAVDFQDLAWGHVEQDLAHSIYALTRGVDLVAGLAAFRAGYERVRAWPGLDLASLTELVAARRVAMVNLAVFRRRPGLDAYVARHADALRDYAGTNALARPDSMRS